MATRNQAPIKEFRAGSIKAAIWKEEREDQGRTTVTFSVKIQKRFFDKAIQDWRDTEYFFPNDIPRLCLVAEKAFEFVALHESDDDDAVGC